MQLAAALQKAPEMSLPAPLPTSSLPEGKKNSVHLIKCIKGIFIFFCKGVNQTEICKVNLLKTKIPVRAEVERSWMSNKIALAFSNFAPL